MNPASIPIIAASSEISPILYPADCSGGTASVFLPADVTNSLSSFARAPSSSPYDFGEIAPLCAFPAASDDDAISEPLELPLCETTAWSAFISFGPATRNSFPCAAESCSNTLSAARGELEQHFPPIGLTPPASNQALLLQAVA